MNSFLFKDYASWKIENHEVLDKFKENNNVIYDRFEPIFEVLEYIYNQIVEGQEVDEDLETIFQFGFEYLYTQLEIVKAYFTNLFQSNCDDFEAYSEMVLYLLYITDIRIDMENNQVVLDFDLFDMLEEYIENMIMERGDQFEYVRTKLNEALQKVDELIDYNYSSVVDIYSEICDNLGIFLYEDDDLVIGEDI